MTLWLSFTVTVRKGLAEHVRVTPFLLILRIIMMSLSQIENSATGMSKSYRVTLVYVPNVRSADEHVSMFKVNMKNEAVHLVPGLGSLPWLVMWKVMWSATCENSGLQDASMISWAMTYHTCLQNVGGKTCPHNSCINRARKPVLDLSLAAPAVLAGLLR